MPKTVKTAISEKKTQKVPSEIVTEAPEEATDIRRHYELLLLLPPQFSDKEREEIFKEWQKTVIDEGGEITLEEVIGLRELAYQISHFEHGYYAFFHFLIDPSKQKTLKKKLIVDTRLLRFLLVQIPLHYQIEIFDKDIVYGGKVVDTSSVTQALEKERKRGKKAGDMTKKEKDQIKEGAEVVESQKEAAKLEPKEGTAAEKAEMAEKAGGDASKKPEELVMGRDEGETTKEAMEKIAEKAVKEVPKEEKPKSKTEDSLIKERHDGAPSEAERIKALDEKLKELLGN